MKKGFIFLSFLAFMLSTVVLRANPPVPSKGYVVESVINPVKDSVAALETTTVITVANLEMYGYTDYGIPSTGYTLNVFALNDNQIAKITLTNPIDYGITYNLNCNTSKTCIGYNSNNKGSTIRKLIS